MITRLRCTTTALIATIAAATGVLVVQQRANHRLQAVQHQACTAIDENLVFMRGFATTTITRNTRLATTDLDAATKAALRAESRQSRSILNQLAKPACQEDQ